MANVSLKKNIAANYAAQIYVTVIGIVMAPVYLSYMGAEAYGLIGFFTMMSVLFQLLDVGLTPTMIRETARFRGGAIDAKTLRMFLRALEAVFGIISIAGGAAVMIFAGWIATHWLKVEHLAVDQVTSAIVLMGATIPLRWVSGLYRGVIAGFERQVWLGGYNTLVATLRFVGILAVFATIGHTPVHFFAYQVIVAIAELTGLTVMTYRLMPRIERRAAFSWKPLLRNLNFSLTIAFTASVGVLVTQTDKLVLSKILPLAAFGIFSIAVAAAGAINAASGPFSQALLPRLTKLIAEKDEDGAYRLYERATQMICMLVVPAVALLCFFAEPVLWAWTDKADIAQQGAVVLRLYAMGNGILVLNAFGYYMQYAKGDLLLHFWGNAVSMFFFVPLFIWAANHFGGLGTGAVWAGVNALYFFAWIPVIHARVFKGHHWAWMRNDVGPIVIPTVLAGWAFSTLIILPANRWSMLSAIFFVGVVLFAVASISSSAARIFVLLQVGRLRRRA